MYAKPRNEASDINKNTAKFMNKMINANRAWIALGVNAMKSNIAKKRKMTVIVSRLF